MKSESISNKSFLSYSSNYFSSNILASRILSLRGLGFSALCGFRLCYIIWRSRGGKLWTQGGFRYNRVLTSGYSRSWEFLFFSAFFLFLLQLFCCFVFALVWFVSLINTYMVIFHLFSYYTVESRFILLIYITDHSFTYLFFR